MEASIAFIGGGNMAGALIGGLLGSGHPPVRVLAVEPDPARRAALAERFGIAVVAEAGAVLAPCQVWVLAVKPQVLPGLARGLAPLAAIHRPLVISVAAGVGSDAIAGWLGAELPIVRCMPNTPALIGAGATALYARGHLDENARVIADTLLGGAGMTVWMEDENALDAVTATSGSGPAYYFALMEAMQTTAEELGLAPNTARRLVLHTALGAARMALESGADPATLRAQITSPGGTTERALAVLSDGGFAKLVAEAMRAAAARSRQMGRELAEL